MTDDDIRTSSLILVSYIGKQEHKINLEFQREKNIRTVSQYAYSLCEIGS